ncbi:sigma 54 modulation/S30EA ribosomal C-terminal domain-containing protein [Kitasatospora sp. NPDC001683]
MSGGALGTTLATATRTSNQPHLSDQWAADLRKAGAELLSEEPPVGMGTRPYIPRGYQVLAGILRNGNYDPHFLNPIAEHVVQLDAKDTNRTRPFWPDFGGDERGIFNIVGQDGAAGYQPITGILEALGHSPEAATKFFHDQPTAYNTDGTVNPNGKPRPADYLHYLAHDKEFKPDTLSYDKDAQAKSQASGPLAFGHALEAATSGHPYDETPNPPLQHRADQAEVMTKVMDEFGHTTAGGSLARITGKDAPLAALRPSLGHLVADYMGDVQHSFSKFDNTLPVNGALANLDPSHVRAVLNQLGRDPEAYGSVINAQQAYTTALIHREFAGGETNAAKLALPIDNAASSGGAIAFHLFTDAASGRDSVVHRDPADGGYRLATAEPHAEPVPGLPLSTFGAPRLAVAEAVARLDLGGLPFVFFTDAATGRGNVLYHRYDGHYGLITPVL